MKTDVAIVRCNDYESSRVCAAVRQSVEFLGGMRAFIKPKSKVLVKPNLLMAKAPECGITTHPEVLRGVIRLLKEIECRIYVGDGPSVWGKQIINVDRVYEVSQAKRVCAEENVELVQFDQRRWRGKFPLSVWLDTCDYVVNVPKFKTHDLTLLTGAVKNLFGLVSGTYKTELHKKHFAVVDFSSVVVDVYEQVKPQLTIVDGIVAMEGDGPATSGELRQQNIIVSGADCVAVDSVLAAVMGIKPQDVPTTQEAARRSLGCADLFAINIIGESLAAAATRPFKLPTTNYKKKLPEPLMKAIAGLIKYYPYVLPKACIRCGACVDACPMRCISLRPKGITFDYRKCIACFCCQEACPAAAIKVKKSFFARAIGL